MCGILGFITDKPSDENYVMLGDLLYISSSRGTDATGVAVVGTKTKVVKEDIPADKFIVKYYKGLKRDIDKAKIVLGHTRLATQGHQKDNNNNHPIIGQKYIMVHNGTCSSMDKIKDYPYKGTVDSEVLLSHIEKKGLKEGLKALKGSAAVAIIKEDEPDVVYLWRHSNPLWVAYDPEKQVLFFGSTEDILKEGLSNLLNFFSSFHMRQLVEDVLYKVTCNPLKIEALVAIEPVGFGYTYSRKGYTGTMHRSTEEGDLEDYYNGYLQSAMLQNIDKEDKSKTTATCSDTDVATAATFSQVYRALTMCQWDKANKVFTTDKLAELPDETKYYFSQCSCDFTNWNRLEGGGHVSIDKKLVKFFDHIKRTHFLMTVTDAIKEGMIDMSK
uniref:glutamine--fructose-6-phosphate transaminase (isomerizing) n=1 Tax=viral metagenome TaxID=1070528 RepID=A0A6M3IS35_9ZZZZ